MHDVEPKFVARVEPPALMCTAIRRIPVSASTNQGRLDPALMDGGGGGHWVRSATSSDLYLNKTDSGECQHKSTT